MAKENYTGLDRHQQAFVKTLHQVARTKRPHEVFRDFCEMLALAISNAVDLAQWEAREARYMDIVNRYSRDERMLFPVMREHIVDSLEEDMSDCLGAIFMAMDLGSAWHGQFFTPYPVARLMASLVGAGTAAELPAPGFETFMEPAVGAGAMVIATAHAQHDAGLNYQQRMHVTAVDVDSLAVHMAYIQFSLLHIPAIVVHGNTLTLEEFGHWVTPAHVVGGWDFKLRAARSEHLAQRVQVFDPPSSDDIEPAPAVLAEVRQKVVQARIDGQLALFE